MKRLSIRTSRRSGRLRYCPVEHLPSYAFVPGRSPHPTRDPRGHSFGADSARFGAPPHPDSWQGHRRWLYQLDLFNHGYYWEAHEGFEWWWSVGEPPLSSFFRGLLRLSAAGVKARQGNAAGVRRHCTRALLLFEGVGLGDAARVLGLNPRDLERDALSSALHAERIAHVGCRACDASNVLGVFLQPLRG